MTTEPEYPHMAPPDPPEPAAGADLLDDVHEFLTQFVAFPSEAAGVAMVLWIGHAHGVHLNLFDSSPRAALLSPEPASGKTRTLEVAELLVPRAMHALNASIAPIFRSISTSTGPPTLLFDEVDAIFGQHGKNPDHDDLRGVLNAGHRRGATVPRCVGPNHDVREFPVFAAVALAGLGDLPDTLMSRSVIIRMRRRAPHEEVLPFRYRDAEKEGHELRERLATWIAEQSDALRDTRPEMPDGVTDRPADVWEPLLAVADTAGGDWPKRARAACTELVAVSASREASLGVRLLTDLRDVFGSREAMHTDTLLAALCGLDEAPWGDLHGAPLDARGLARRLRAYGITSTTVRLGERVAKGYRREAGLWDAWARYLLPTPTPSEGEQGLQGEQPRSDGGSPVTASTHVTAASVTRHPIRNAPTWDGTDVTDVTLLREGSRCRYCDARCDPAAGGAHPECAEAAAQLALDVDPTQGSRPVSFTDHETGA